MKAEWETDKMVARAILGSRAMRRKALAISLMIALGLLSIGLWVIDGWLAEAAWRFLLWWGGCGLVTVWVILFALYDALASLQEVKGAKRK